MFHLWNVISICTLYQMVEKKFSIILWFIWHFSVKFFELFRLEISLLSLNWSIKMLIKSLNEDLSQRGHPRIHTREKSNFFFLSSLKTNERKRGIKELCGQENKGKLMPSTCFVITSEAFIRNTIFYTKLLKIKWNCKTTQLGHTRSGCQARENSVSQSGNRKWSQARENAVSPAR